MEEEREAVREAHEEASPPHPHTPVMYMYIKLDTTIPAYENKKKEIWESIAEKISIKPEQIELVSIHAGSVILTLKLDAEGGNGFSPLPEPQA